MYIMINDEILKENQKALRVDSESFNYGYSLFETIKLFKNEVFFLKEHLERLKLSCEKLDINYNLDYDEVSKRIKKLISLNNLESGSIKLLYTKQAELIISIKSNKYTKEQYERGFKLCFANTVKNEHSILSYIKSANYLENLLIKKEINKRGYDETILINTKNNLSEGTYTNLFFVKKEIIYTPDISCGLLDGIMRQKVINLSKDLKIKLIQGCFTKSSLIQADEIFITNSLMEIMPVVKMEDRCFEIGKNHITSSIIKEFKRVYYKN